MVTSPKLRCAGCHPLSPIHVCSVFNVVARPLPPVVPIPSCSPFFCPQFILDLCVSSFIVVLWFRFGVAAVVPRCPTLMFASVLFIICLVCLRVSVVSCPFEPQYFFFCLVCYFDLHTVATFGLKLTFLFAPLDDCWRRCRWLQRHHCAWSISCCEIRSLSKLISYRSLRSLL